LAQYGLPPPPQTQPATGFADIVTSRVVGPDGGALRAQVQGATVVIRVPPGALSAPLHVAMTAPKPSSFSSLSACLALVDATVDVAVGVEAKTERGSVVRGRLGERPFTLSIGEDGITPEWRVARSRGVALGPFVPLKKAVVRDGLTRARFNRAGVFLVIAPRSEPPDAEAGSASTPRPGCPA
jgi:hypothetical protein